MKRGKAKVKWKDVCIPRSQGGLGLKNLRTWSTTLISKHLWNIADRKDSIWVKWVHIYHLKNRSLWDVPIPNNCCWSWRKILQSREKVWKFIKYQMGNGRNTHFWFDNWHELGPLYKFVSRRSIFERGLDMNATVSDMIGEHGWRWPIDWVQIHPSLTNLNPPELTPHIADKRVWVSSKGVCSQFSINAVWMELREEQDVVPWAKWVWYSQCIPRHSFILWLALKNKLKTQDKIRLTAAGPPLTCPFCKSGPDSHDHLFFGCMFTKGIWVDLKKRARLHQIPEVWSDIILHLCQLPVNKSIWSIIQRLLMGAMVYYIWQERNLRLFQGKERNATVVSNLITEAVRYRLMGLRINESIQVKEALRVWEIDKRICCKDLNQ